MAFETFEKMGGFIFYSFIDSFRLILPSGGRFGFYTLLSVLYLHIVSYWLFKLTSVQTKQTRGGQQCVAHHCSNNQMASKEPHSFLQFVLLPLGETIKGRHGQAEDSVELLRWEVALGKQGRLKALKAEGPVWLEKTHQHLQRLQAEGVKKWGGCCICPTMFASSQIENVASPPPLPPHVRSAVCYRMICDLVHTEPCRCSPPVGLGPHRLEDAAAPWLTPPGLHKGRSAGHTFTLL